MPYRIPTYDAWPLTIPDASETAAGVMSAADKFKLDHLSVGGTSWKGQWNVATAYLVGDGVFYAAATGAQRYVALLNNTGVVPTTVGTWAPVADGESLVLDALQFAGADLGAQINAADAFLGAVPGSIYVQPGNYAINTPVVLSNNHRLHLGTGHYTTAGIVAPNPVFALRDNTVLEGEGWGTIIDEPPSFAVVIAFNSLAGGPNTPQNALVIRDFRINGLPPPAVGAVQNIQLGNVHKCQVTSVYFDHSRGLGCLIGADSNTGVDLAQDVWVSKCIFDGVLGDNVICTNGRQIHVENNNFLTPGDGTAAALSIGFNFGGDPFAVIEHISVVENMCNLTGALSANCMQLQIIDAASVVGNILLGDPTTGSGTAIDIRGCFDSLIEANNIFGSFTEGIGIRDSQHVLVVGNRLLDCGTQTAAAPPVTGTFSIIIEGVVTSLVSIIGNSIKATLAGAAPHSCSIASPLDPLALVADQVFIYNNDLGLSWTGAVTAQPFIYVIGPSTRVWPNNMATVMQRGPAEKSRRRVAADTDITPLDEILGVDTTLGAVAVTLPNPAAWLNGGQYVYDLNGSGANVGRTTGARFLFITDEGGNALAANITVKRFAAEKINRVAGDLAIATNGGGVFIYTDGTDWYAFAIDATFA